MKNKEELQELFDILKKRFWLILICVITGLAVSIGLTFLVIEPEYSSRIQLVVTLPKGDELSSSGSSIDNNLKMISTYKELITSDLVLEKVQNLLQVDYDQNLEIEAIREGLSVTQTEDSLMFSIVSIMNSPKIAQNVAEVTAQTFQANAKQVLNDTVDSITIISNASLEEEAVSPNTKLNLALGVLLGAIIGLLIVFFLELVDRKVREDKYIVESLNLLILGKVSSMSEDEKQQTIHQIIKNQQEPKSRLERFNEGKNK